LVIDFSKLNLKEKPTLVLKNLDGTAIQTLGFAFNVNGDLCYNEVSTINFDIPATENGQSVPNYENVVGMKIVDLVDIGQFILIDPVTNSSDGKEIKHCKAYSLEYEWVKKGFFLEAGTFNFYDPLAPENTIIGRLLEKMSDWSIGEIDSSLIGKYRTFEDISSNCYNFVKQNVQESYSCIFNFDTYNRKIYVISVDATIPTKQIYLSKDRLIHDLEINENSDEIVTCLDVNGEEGVSIRTVNPTGTNVIYNLDYFMNTSNFTQTLIDKWHQWESACNAYQLPYYNLMIEYNLKTSQKLAEKAKLVDLQSELTSLENQQAVIIQAIAQNLQDQSALTNINSQIRTKNTEISAQNTVITNIDNRISSIISSLSEINQLLAMDHKSGNTYTYFTPSELAILKRYFIEDSLEDSSFAMPSTTTYDNVDISNTIANVSVSITNSQETTAVNTSTQKMYSFNGGTINVGNVLIASIIQATLDWNPSTKNLVFSAYLERGNVSDVDFSSGTITISGKGTASLSGNTGLSMFIESATFYFTRNSTEYEQHTVEWDLFEYGKSVLYEKASPTYNFSVRSSNFLAMDDFETFKNELVLGHRVYMNLDDNILTPYVTIVHFDYNDLTDFSIDFGNTYTSFDSAIRLAKLLEQSVSMGKSLNTKSGMYAEFVNSKASTKVKDFMSSALDIAKNAVMSSGEQAITFDDTGLRIRKWKNKEAGTYEDEQIWIIDNVIAFTKDAWTTSNMAIGKIFDENIKNYIKTTDTSRDTNKTYYVDQNGTVWDGSTAWNTNLYELDHTAYGIVAPYLVGTILAGSNLIIDTDNGSFRVDSSGVYIDSLKFYITHGASTYDTTLAEELNNLSNADSQIAQDFADAIDNLKDDYIPSNTITTFYQGSSDGIPSGKEGDLWYVNGNEDIIDGDYTYYVGTLYRYNGAEWQKIEDSDATTAIANAATAQSTADRKIVSYYQNTVPDSPDYGDIWYNTATTDSTYKAGKLYRYDGEQWKLVEDTDIQTLKNKTDTIATNMSNAIHELNAAIDATTTTYYTDTTPTNPNEGDLWYFTGEDDSVIIGYATYNSVTGKTVSVHLALKKGHLYRFNGDYWQEIEDANAIQAIAAAGDAQATADQKIMFYRQDYTTSGIPSIGKNSLGDIWFNTATVDKDGFIAGKLYRCNGTTWELVEDKDIGVLKNDVTTINNTIKEFYNSGYLDSSKLQGTIDAQQSQMQSSSGNVLFDKDGIWLMNATTKSQATKAIWMNENGILFGSGSKSNDPGASGSGWTWTTAINHDGITANALAGKTLSGVKVYVGDGLYVGAKTVNGTTVYDFQVDKNGNLSIGRNTDGTYNFKVDRNGNLTARNGDFSGNVNATNIKLMNANGVYQSILTTTAQGQQKISSDYLSLLGLTIKNSSGATAMSITANGITLYGGAITWGSDIPASDISGLAAVATTGNYNSLTNKPTIPTIPSYIQSTYIDQVEIRSPTIKGNTFNVYPTNALSSSSGSFNIYGNWNNQQYLMSRIRYYGGDAAYVYYESPASAYARWNYPSTDFNYNVTFYGNTYLYGITCLDSDCYGSSLPTGYTGRIFFKTT